MPPGDSILWVVGDTYLSVDLQVLDEDENPENISNALRATLAIALQYEANDEWRTVEFPLTVADASIGRVNLRHFGTELNGVRPRTYQSQVRLYYDDPDIGDPDGVRQISPTIQTIIRAPGDGAWR